MHTESTNYRMRQLYILLILQIITTVIHAQQMISVIDASTREPISNATFIQDGKNISYTSPEGLAVIPKLSGMITITAQDYKSATFLADSIPAVVHLESDAKPLDEVTILGDASRIKSKSTNWGRLKKATSVGSHGQVSIGLDAIFRFFGYRPASEKRRERVRKILREYDTPAPNLQDKSR